MATQRRAGIEEGRGLIAKQYERLCRRLTMLPETPTELSEKQLRQILNDVEFPLVERILKEIRSPSPPKKLNRRLEAAIPPPSRNNAPRRSTYDDYITSKSYQEKYDEYQDKQDKYQGQLALLTKEELIEKINGLWEATTKEIKELKPKREWWTAPRYKADFEHWCRKDYWTAEEGVILSLGLDPREVYPEQLQAEKGYGRLPEEFSDRQEIVATCVQSKKIDIKRNDPKVFIDWLEAKGYSYPDELKQVAEKTGVSETSDKKPDYLNPDHERHSQELRIAIEAWEYFKDRKIAKKTPKKAIEEWLNEHQPKLSNEAKTRIAIIVNWEKGGGPPKSE